MNYSWIINGSNKKSKLLNDHKTFGDSIFILDHLSGKEPLLLNENILMYNENKIGFIPAALLDSNMSSAIYRFIEKGEIAKGLLEFIEFTTRNKWGYIPYFYYMEAYTKSILYNNESTIRESLINNTKSLLNLYLMDEEYFLEEKKYRATSNQTQINFYLKNKDVDTVATEMVEDFILNYKGEHVNILPIKILLIKMIFIKLFEGRKKLKDMLCDFDEFMQNNIGKIFAREMYLAKKYFTDTSGKIFGIQKNTKFEKVASTIESTAWDLFLLRLPELNFVGENEFDIGFIVTQEKSLFSLGKLFKYECIDIENGVPIPHFIDSEKLSFIKMNDSQKEDLQNLYDSMLRCLRNYFPN